MATSVDRQSSQRSIPQIDRRPVLVAPSAWKGSFSAAAAARVMARALAPRIVRTLAIADGGDGTAAVLARALGGRPLRIATRGVLGERRRTRVWALADGGGALDMASAAGLRLLLVRGEPLRPLDATSLGLGDAIRAAASLVPDGPLYVGLGGSASTDGGAGLLVALGGRLLDRRGRSVPPTGRGLQRLARLDLGAIPLGLGARVVALVDVDAPLLGERGSARAFAPQKGADVSEVARLEAALARLRAVAERDLGVAPDLAERAGAGAAGGAGYALMLLGARLVPGADAVLDRVAFDRELAAAAALIVGEAGFDATSFAGKAPVRALERARRLGLPRALVCARADAAARRRLEGEGTVVVEAAPDGGRADATDLARATRAALVAIDPF